MQNADQGQKRNKFIRRKLRKLFNEAFKTSIMTNRPFTTESLLESSDNYFISPYITPREMYPLILEKQFNLISLMINKNVVLKTYKIWE